MKIAVLGTRGFPNVQGGVERHCERLYPRLVELGCSVTVFSRAPYVGEKTEIYKGVELIPLKCPKNKFLEAVVHTFRGVIAASRLKPDILHIHAIGPSLAVPFAKMLGLKVVMTHHGPDYERKKWGIFAKIVLKFGELFGVIFADTIITISETIARSISDRYGRVALVIPNGVDIPELVPAGETLKRFELEKGKYILAVGRFVPEKGFHDLVDAWGKSQVSSLRSQEKAWKLVIVGDADHADKYSAALKKKAKETPGVVLTGYMTGEPLAELYSNAGLFVLPSYYEGLPIVLLEALSYGLSCIVSDIPANKEVNLTIDRYFRAGDIDGIASALIAFIDKPMTGDEKRAQVQMVKERYDWDAIAARTFDVYKSLR